MNLKLISIILCLVFASTAQAKKEPNVNNLLPNPEQMAYSIYDIANEILQEHPQLRAEVDRLKGHYTIYEFQNSAGPKANIDIVGIMKLSADRKSLVELTAEEEVDALHAIKILSEQAARDVDAAAEYYGVLLEKKTSQRNRAIAREKITLRGFLAVSAISSFVFGGVAAYLSYSYPVLASEISTNVFEIAKSLGILLAGGLGVASFTAIVRTTGAKIGIYLRQSGLRKEISKTQSQLLEAQVYSNSLARINELAHKSKWSRETAAVCSGVTRP